MSTKKKRSHGISVSYRTYLVFSFTMVAAITAALIISVMSIVFNMYFTTYTSDNMDTVAEFMATRIADEYAEKSSLNSVDYEALMQTLRIGEDTGVVVIDNSGNPFYDNTAALANAGYAPDGHADFSSATRVASATIAFDGRTIGSVRLWIYGADTLMSRLDLQFRNNTYEALILISLVAVLIAALIGFALARKLVRPVMRVSEAARQIAEGNLSARTGLVGPNEIERLGEDFDEMAASLERDRQLELRLTSDVAHELRTPLMAIQANVEAMIDGVYEADDEHLALVENEVKRLSRLVDALLRLSRLEARSQPLKEEIVDIGKLVEEIVTAHELFVQDSGLEIEAHVKGTVKAVCDRDMIRQAITNLISNAVRYTTEGRIDVSAQEEDGMAVVSVADTGIGLTPEEEKMVFSRFWRADSSRKKETGGLGVGLAIVKEIVNRHGGTIKVKGEKGVGSTFTIMIPAYDEVTSQREARAAIKAFERRNRRSGHKGSWAGVAGEEGDRTSRQGRAQKGSAHPGKDAEGPKDPIAQ